MSESCVAYSPNKKGFLNVINLSNKISHTKSTESHDDKYVERRRLIEKMKNRDTKKNIQGMKKEIEMALASLHGIHAKPIPMYKINSQSMVKKK